MSDELNQFRLDARQWLEANCPASMRTPMPEQETPWGGRRGKFPNPDSRLWLDRMAQRGWTAPTWPKEYGGAGLTAEQEQVLKEEMKRINARPPLFSFGLWMLGPVLLEYATDEQKARFLPEIARGEIRWCQGYSEPGAGSDLASLKTRAVIDGDNYIVNGSKIWTSEAADSDWIFCLVRSDSAVPKHQGISFLLFDLETEGVDIKPIDLISGGSNFNQVFFDDVVVPTQQRVGEENLGWLIAKRLLSYERQNVAGVAFGADTSQSAADIARRYAQSSEEGIDPALRLDIAGQMLRAEALDCLSQRILSSPEESAQKGLEAVLKVTAAANNQLRSELIVEAMGAAGLAWNGDGYSKDEINNTRAWLRSRGNSIEGGTSEVNLNIIAKRVLGLPDPGA